MMRVTKLSLRMGERTLIRALDWHIQAGECWGIIGRNGAGKSTLLRTLAGMGSPIVDTASGVNVVTMHDGTRERPLSDWPLMALAKARAYLPQSRVDAFAYSVIETVLAARHPYHDAHYWEPAAEVELALAALRALDVAELAQRDVRSLSGGERQRVAIAGLLAQDAALLLLDEPTNSLDLSHQVSVMRLLSGLCREQGKSVVMASHDLNLLRHGATHALMMMGDGTWIAGAVAEVMTADNLGRCLGHPIEAILHGEQTIFLPRAG